MAELILELFSEEIPARMQRRASEDLVGLLTQGLAEAGLGHGDVAGFATPRRLTVHVADLALATEAVSEEFKGPRADAPEKALAGFLKKVGLTKDQLELRDDKKGQVYFAVVQKPARAAADVIASLAPEIIRGFPWPKSMRWGDGDLRWVRPLRSIACVVSDGETVTVPAFEIGGIAASRTTYGHRFHAPEPIEINSFAQYKAALADAKVLLDPAERMAAIDAGARAAAKKAKLELVEDPGLLAEVAGLVEHPVVLWSKIDKAFHDLPPEVLQTSMKEHQKFFSLRDNISGGVRGFVTVSNLEARDGGKRIVAGNERVLRARLADAQFFYQNDLAVPLEDRIKTLQSVTFHNQIGSQGDRVARIRALARALAPLVGAAPEQAERAAQLAKADLATEMVYEFPELQGLMGRYYAQAAGETGAVAEAIERHYAPQGPHDPPATEPVAIAVALADKIDQLAAFWAIGQRPKGSGDPFALRRAALGVIRTVLDNGLRLRLGRALKDHAERLNPDLVAVARRGSEVIAEAPAKTLDAERALMREEGYKAEAGERVVIDRRLFGPALQADLLAFIAERLKVHLRSTGVRHDVIDAVYAQSDPVAPPLSRKAGKSAAATSDRPAIDDDLTRLARRIEAVGALIEGPDGADLLAAFKRANNILQAEEAKDGVEYGLDPDVKYATEDAETALFAALESASEAIGPAMKDEDFPRAMASMAALREPLDAFFDNVVVNAELEIVRRNRLCLLNKIRRTMSAVADFAQIEG